MAKPETKISRPQNGSEGRYCALCGVDADINGPGTERFGEAFCSEGHAEEFVREVKAARVQAAAALAAQAPDTEVQQAETQAAGTPKQQRWKRYLKWGACCGAPLLALVVLAGGGGALLGAAGSLLPVLALLACPIGMFVMMWAMSKAGHHKSARDDKEKN